MAEAPHAREPSAPVEQDCADVLAAIIERTEQINAILFDAHTRYLKLEARRLRTTDQTADPPTPEP